MGLFDGMLGNASKIDASKIQQEFAQILAPGERVEHAYQLIRDYFVFTDKRFVLVDKQGLTAREGRVSLHSLQEHHPLQRGDRRHIRSRRRTEDMDFRHARAGTKAVQQEAEHLRSAGSSRELRAAIAPVERRLPPPRAALEQQERRLVRPAALQQRLGHVVDRVRR